ncbi:MAG: PDZ domain-containing protein [Candidatus Nanopelagicales bacterium]
MSRRGRIWVGIAGVLILVVISAAVLLPIPFVARAPGPVFDILGEVDGKPVLVIKDTPSFPTTGTLDMTTVSESGGSAGPMNVGSALVGLFEPDTSVLPDQAPRDEGQRQVDEAIFDESQSAALGAAARHLDRPVRTRVAVLEVVPGSPSEGRLAAGDTIVSIDGKRITQRSQVGDAVGAQPVGTTFDIGIDRDGDRSTVQVTSAPDPDDPARPVIGILVAEQFTSDFTVTVNLDNIGGPSAGLMLSVGMVDKLTPGDLLGGRKVAGTGTIDGEGTVGAIGGIDKKMIAAHEAGAELFVAPYDNCADVTGATPDGLQVVPVKSLDDAVTAIQDWRAGKPLPGCPRTGDE